MVHLRRPLCQRAGRSSAALEADVDTELLKLVWREGAVIVIKVDLQRTAECEDAGYEGDDYRLARLVAMAQTDALACVTWIVWVVREANTGGRW